MTTNYPIIQVNKRSAQRLKRGYPWVFHSEIINPAQHNNYTSGELVYFANERGALLAGGFYNPKNQLNGRVLSRNPHQAIDFKFFEFKIKEALQYRNQLYKEPYYRIIFAESDGFPGLIVDRYGDVLVAQANTAGIDKLWPLIEQALISELHPKAIVLRNDTAAREQEGLAQEKRVSYGQLDDSFVPIIENNTAFEVDVLEGQKTGYFFDQRENRAWVAQLAQGKSIIDIFCHTGSFGITALKKGASSATFVDSSEKALADTKRNILANHLKNEYTSIKGKAFEIMEQLQREQKTFGMVCVDPPAFIKSRKDMASGLKGYQKLARLAAPLVEKGGFLFFASCSHHASVTDLLEYVADGLSSSGRTFQLIKTSGAAPDHPAHLLLPETQYLKGLTFRLLP